MKTTCIRNIEWRALLFFRWKIFGCNVVCFLLAKISQIQGRRNDLGIGGQKNFARRSCAKFFIIKPFFKRIQFCSLVYLWFPISTDLLTYFGHISIHWSICRCFYNLEFFGLPKYWGGGGNCPPPLPPLFLRPWNWSAAVTHNHIAVHFEIQPICSPFQKQLYFSPLYLISHSKWKKCLNLAIHIFDIYPLTPIPS